MTNRTNSRMNREQVLSRIDYLVNLLTKYKHRWDENPSPRMMGWVDELNEVIELWPNVYREYCEKNGYEPGTAHDVLA